MEILHKKTDSLPDVYFDKETESIIIQGIIVPENPLLFFDNLESIVHSYSNEYGILTIVFQLDYFNTGAAKHLFDLLKKQDKSKLKVIWKYELDDEDILEAGKDYQELTGIEFNFLSI